MLVALVIAAVIDKKDDILDGLHQCDLLDLLGHENGMNSSKRYVTRCE